MQIYNKLCYSIVIFLAHAFFILPTFSQTTYIWNGVDSTWHEATNWSPNGIPGSSDTVIINSGTVKIYSDVQVTDVTFTAGTITGSSALAVTGQMNWSGGTISGLSELVLSGFLTISGSGYKTIDGVTFTNQGTITITGSGSLRLAGNALLSNQAGATIDIQSNAGIILFNDGGTLSNDGALTKSGGGSISLIDIPLTNTGTVNISSGTLRLSNDSDISNAAVNFSGGGMLELYANTHILDDVIFSGNGTARVYLVSVNITGSGISVNSTATLEIAGYNSNIYGSGAVTINGTLIWDRGTISGSGPFILNNSCVFGSANTKTLDGRTLTNNGTINYNGTGPVRMLNNARLVNQAAGIITFQTGGVIDFLSPFGGALDNAGVVTKQGGTGTMTIDVNFNNTGILEAKTGTISFTRVLLNDTTGIIRGTSTIDISAATFTNYGSFNPGASPGILLVNGNYSQTDTASLDIELGGTIAGTEYDRLTVFGSSQLNGTLNISFFNGFIPQIGDQFEVLLFNGRSGEFSSMNYPDPGIGKDFDTTYTTNSLLLNVIATRIRANIKVWLEGPYHAGGYMLTALNDYLLLPLEQPYNSAPWNYSGTESTSDNPQDIVDWVLVELRTDTTAASTVATRAGWIHADGPVVDMDGVTPLTFDVPGGNYYVVVHHRNHLSIMSASALTLGTASPLYDFTTALTKAYGINPMKQLESGVYGMIAGDGNADGSVDISDRESVWSLQNGTAWDYSKLADFNIDGGIDTYDLNNIWRNNEGSVTSVP